VDGKSAGKRKPWAARLYAFWGREESLSALLLLLIVRLFLLPILGLREGGWLADVAFLLMLVSGVATVWGRRGISWLTVALVLTASLLDWSGLAARSAAAQGVAVAATLGTLAVFTLVVLTRALSPGPINGHRIEGAIAAYLLFGLACALGYQLVGIWRRARSVARRSSLGTGSRPRSSISAWSRLRPSGTAT
jgi:hypothetical protein